MEAWKDVYQFVETFKGASGTMKLTGIYRNDLANPSGPQKRFSFLDFTGERNDDKSGDMIRCRMGYEITEKLGATIHESMMNLLGLNNPPRKTTFGRKFYHEADEGFRVTLFVDPSLKMIIGLQHKDGWEVETDDLDRFGGAFRQAASV